MKNALLRSAPVTACLTAWLGSTLIALTPSAAIASNIYKCAGEGGIPVYQDTPCEKGKELRNLTNDDTLSVVPMRVEPSRLPPPPPPAAPPAVVAPEPVAAIPPQPSEGAPLAVREAEPAPDVPSTPPPAVFPDATTLSATALARIAIAPGMTAAEVEARLGPPPMTGGAGSDAPDQPVRWFYLPTEGDSDTITTIVLKRGKVTDVERKPMKKDY
ncbi:MAG: outer membrane protein assembly factor BamE [Burkholderiales bacterium]|jgi:hypothetical protein|nr:outer membrane protein assembly factor BamE [Burkholderiales bacterium]